MKETPLHPARCGPCIDCAEFLEQYRPSTPTTNDFEAADRLYWRRLFPKAPTLEERDRHIRCYGRECVDEIERAYGLGTPKDAEGRSAVAQDLRRDGKTIREIARHLGVSEKKTRQLLRPQTSAVSAT